MTSSVPLSSSFNSLGTISSPEPSISKAAPKSEGSFFDSLNHVSQKKSEKNDLTPSNHSKSSTADDPQKKQLQADDSHSGDDDLSANPPFDMAKEGVDDGALTEEYKVEASSLNLLDTKNNVVVRGDLDEYSEGSEVLADTVTDTGPLLQLSIDPLTTTTAGESLEHFGFSVDSSMNLIKEDLTEVEPEQPLQSILGSNIQGLSSADTESDFYFSKGEYLPQTNNGKFILNGSDLSGMNNKVNGVLAGTATTDVDVDGFLNGDKKPLSANSLLLSSNGTLEKSDGRSLLLNPMKAGVLSDSAAMERLFSKAMTAQGVVDSAEAAERVVSSINGVSESLPGLYTGTAQSIDLASNRMSIPVNVSFGHAQWGGVMAERTAWAVSQNIQTADIQLDPPELGPIQVKIHVNQDQASVSFVSNNPLVRDALEQTMSRLKELLQEQGMSLVDTGVSDGSQQNNEDDPRLVDTLEESIHTELQDETLPHMQVNTTSGIDFFA